MAEIIRDKRTQAFYITQHIIIDDYYPIINKEGFAIYSLLSSMANRNRHAEVAFPGLRLMKDFLGVGASTITQYTTLLEWVGLIEIERGNRRKSNTYNIVDVSILTPATRAQVAHKLQETHDNITLTEGFIRKITAALKAYKPLSGHFQPRKQAKNTTVTQTKLPLTIHRKPVDNSRKGDPVEDQGDPVEDQGDPVEDQGDPVEDQGDPVEDRIQQGITTTYLQQGITTTSSSSRHAPKQKHDDDDGFNPKTKSEIALKQAGIDAGRKLTQLSTLPYADVLAMIWYVALKPGLRSPIGYMISKLSSGYLPPEEYLALADFYVCASSNLEAWLFGDMPMPTALSDSAAECAEEIYERLGTFDVPNLKTPIKVNQSAQHVPSDLADIIMR